MQFDYAGKREYPWYPRGTRTLRRYHQKFLMAVDAAMVVDSAKGSRGPKPKSFLFLSSFLFRSCQTPWDSCLHLHEQPTVMDVSHSWPLGRVGSSACGCQLPNELALSVRVKRRTLRTFITNAWSFTKVMSAFAKIEDGDTLANNPFYEQAKEDIELFTEAGNEFLRRSYFSRWIDTGLLRFCPLLTLGFNPFLDTFSTCARTMVTRQWMQWWDWSSHRDFWFCFQKIQSQYGPTSPWPYCLCSYVSGEFERGMSVNLTR